MGKSCYTLHFDGVHLLEGVVETAKVSYKSRWKGGKMSVHTFRGYR